jgi:hypothetical protein
MFGPQRIEKITRSAPPARACAILTQLADPEPRAMQAASLHQCFVRRLSATFTLRPSMTSPVRAIETVRLIAAALHYYGNVRFSFHER